ncbi:uncharacterized protein EAE97_009803 [Botrytis byssoidea]|uniref:Uncharacterized protein n=1 Tax=Botrytis byssoidea TaxID=139641 RepID=A0A9P5LXC9_9HELO|nr:uncharacterized protein EAE97_009803 [Botrytis byssoidea]KAF7928961.1 hypothetical protein EAE97_009803 [Botrytis byssoidea]
MKSSSGSLVPSRPRSNLYASLIERRRPAPAPVDADLKVRMSVWERGSRQTNSQLAILIRSILRVIHEEGNIPNPWTVTAVLRSIEPAGPWPQPIQVDLSCRSIDILQSESSSPEEALEDEKEFVDFLFKHLEAIHTTDLDYVRSIYSDRLIGFALKYPAIPDGETSYSRLDIQKFHLPEVENLETFRTKLISTKFYHGPLLALDRVAEVVSAYKEMIQTIPHGSFQNANANMGLAAAKAAVGMQPIMENHPLLKDLDRSTVDDLVHHYTPPVIRCMEEVLDALEKMAMATKSREPCPRQTCDILSKIYQLKRSTPALTAVLVLLADKKAQEKYIWGSVIVGGVIGVVIGASLLCAAIGVGSSMTLVKFLQEAESHNTMFINQKVNDSLGMIVYYIALCFMKSNGIVNLHSDDDQVNKIMEKLYGQRPTQIAKKQYRAAFLHNLVGKLAKDFREVIAGLRKLGYARLTELEWTPQPLITESESTMTF